MSETLFKEVKYDLSSLMKFIELGEIGLPDIQRPFVWRNSKVRDLFDSMYRGYPVGYFLFWQNAFSDDAKAIGVDSKQKPPSLLIVDGQQRLTSLYAVVRGVNVVRENFEEEPIHIAFNPLQEKFEVADAAIRKDKAYIPNISVLWKDSTDLFEVVDNYLDGLKSVRELALEEEKKVKSAIQRLNSLTTFPFTALELSAIIDEEQVGDVFVRINSKGQTLNQADFILTLMSVFWDEGRKQLENFSRAAHKPSKSEAAPFNYFIEPNPDQLLRVSIGVGFRRARLKNVYSILRGKDIETDEFSAERRDEQFKILKDAQEKTLNVQYWHDFMKVLLQSGHRSGKMITSQNNLLFAYILYLLGKTEYGVKEHELRRVLARWFFMSSLTGRFTSSPETKMEFDLARLREVNNAEEFVNTLDRICNETLTGDFWSITLPNDLATSAARSPSLYAYYAALSLLDARVLFSKQKVTELLDPQAKAKKSAIERHHLFPKDFLKKQGITDRRDTNQIANFALVEWGDNIDISNKAPAEYVPEYVEEFSGAEIAKMYHWHALPDGWETMDYRDFLVARRELMAGIIREGYETLAADGEDTGPAVEGADIEKLIGDGETVNVEFKATLRMNRHTGEKDPRMEQAALKTIAGFLNTKGGTLFIGVEDNGNAIGTSEDGFANEDKMHLHLVNLLKSRLDPTYMMYIHPRFEEYGDERVMVVECWPAKSPVFLKDGKEEKFFIRTGAATSELSPSQTTDYIKHHFKN